MKREELWKIYTDKNPLFLVNGCNFTPNGLRKFFEQTWDTAHKQGVANGKAIGKDIECKSAARNILNKMCGGL